MRVFGTAGHVDHGKSTLVRALTGIDPDRLAEEKAREMTIDLGFAWLDLAVGRRIGIVDVPGHRDFIENMLAGIGGIDAALLIVAADEGVMPQTREHLAILNLLGIEHGIIVLTKIDMIESAEWLELVEQDIRGLVTHSSLSNAIIVRVSARKGQGLDELVKQMGVLLDGMPQIGDTGVPRLPIDRVFSASGFGTVVTGTLSGGSLQLGQELEIQPSGAKARIRGLQSYGEAIERAESGSRVAVNLAGITYKEVARGDTLSRPGLLQPSKLIDVRFELLADVSRPLKHDTEVKIYVGTSESTGHVRLVADDVLLPGASSWLQIRLDQPLAVVQGDRFILRCPSPSETIGGGLIVNPHPSKRWKRFDQDVIHDLDTRLNGSPIERLVQAASVRGLIGREELYKLLRYDEKEFEYAIAAAMNSGVLRAFPQDRFLSNVAYEQIVQQLLSVLEKYHQLNPLKLGMPREELRTRLEIPFSSFVPLMESLAQIVVDHDIVRLVTHEVYFTPAQQKQIAALNTILGERPYSPPSFRESVDIVGEEILYALLELGQIVRVQPDVIFSSRAYREMTDAVIQIIDERGEIAANELRDRFGTTRKYAIGLLDHLDEINVTRRVGDVRVRGTSPIRS